MTMFSSRPPFNDDPHPWVWSPHSPRNKARADTDMFRAGANGRLANYEHAPRPEFDRPQNNPTNPILTDIRVHYRGDWGAMLRTFEYVTANAAHYVTKDWLRVTDEAQIAHAHRVLARLASFGGAD